jgi:endonuclease/exonuclease/phosphatase family metal-dependent hydrolase
MAKKSVARRLIRKVCSIITILCCITYLVSCLLPYLNPANWWFIGFLGLTFPYQATILIFAIIFWLIAKPSVAIIPLITLLAGYKQLTVLFAVHPSGDFAEEKQDSAIRIVDWNVGNMYGLSSSNDIRKHNRTEIAGAILKLNPDVICLQEFNHSMRQGEEADNIGLFSGKYPHYFFSKDVNKRGGYYQYGSIIFSKYPIINAARVPFPQGNIESLIYADIVLHGDTIRLFTSHLQSFKFTSSDYADMNRIKEQNKEALAASKNIITKMRYAFQRRGVQADVVQETISDCPHSSVICGDFNDVPNSYTYFHIRGLRQDAFLARGFGVGKTYNALAPTLRIDYILPDTTFNIHQFDMVDEDLSDHSMLVTDISLKKER